MIIKNQRKLSAPMCSLVIGSVAVAGGLAYLYLKRQKKENKL